MTKDYNEKIAALKAKQEKTAARISALQSKAKSEERRRDTRRKIVVGGAVLHAMSKDPQLTKLITQLLDRSVGRPIDRDVIVDLLPPSPAPPAVAFLPAAQESLAS